MLLYVGLHRMLASWQYDNRRTHLTQPAHRAMISTSGAVAVVESGDDDSGVQCSITQTCSALLPRGALQHAVPSLGVATAPLQSHSAKQAEHQMVRAWKCSTRCAASRISEAGPLHSRAVCAVLQCCSATRCLTVYITKIEDRLVSHSVCFKIACGTARHDWRYSRGLAQPCSC